MTSQLLTFRCALAWTWSSRTVWFKVNFAFNGTLSPGVDSSAISSPNLEELDRPKHSSTFSSVFNQLFANAIAQQAILLQARSIWGSKSSLHLYIVTLKSRLRTRLGCCELSLIAIRASFTKGLVYNWEWLSFILWYFCATTLRKAFVRGWWYLSPLVQHNILGWIWCQGLLLYLTIVHFTVPER